MAIRCPNADCGYAASADASLAGRSVTCPRCGTHIIVPPSAAPGGVLGRIAASKQPQPVTAWEIGQTILEDYRVEGKLGEGGMGIVYLVSHIDEPSIQFAVKRARAGDEASRRTFLAELQTWIDLPEHPNLAACRFFRTDGDEVLIFAEYLPGGSLSSWIRGGRLPTLDPVLDVAIQFAWGLHQAHELGLVHQDVKPGNVLMTEDGIAKVADFGLSRARARAESGRTVVPLATDGMWTPAAGGSVLVSSGGMTPAYCSPEQAEGKRLSRRTDQWSWAVSVLEMFTGEVTWGYGIAARDALEDYASTGGGRLPLPASMADALRRCLEWSPESRYETMLDAACQLSRVHELGTGRTYARLPPRAMPRDEWVQGRLERRTIYMGTWRHPREWIEKALAEAGRSPAEAESLLPDYSGSRQAQAVADLLAYETAHQLLRTLSTRGRDLEAVLAELCTEKGMVHQKLEDLPGARAMHDQAVALLERLVTVEGRTELCHRLADARYHQAWSHIYPRPSPVAVPAADRAIGLLTELVSRNPDGDLAAGLVGARSARCLALVLQGRRGDAISEFAETISWAERVFAARPSDKLAGALAGACSLSAMAGLLAGQGAAAVDPLRRAIGLLRHLVYDLGQREFLLYLAEAYQNYGVWLRSQGQLDEALESTRWSVEVCERLVRDEGRGDLAVSLPVAYLGLALVHWLRGNAADARQATARAAEAFRQVVYLRGRTDQLTGFGILLSQAGDAASKAGDREGAVREYRRAIQILHRQPRGQLVLAQTHQACAQVLWELAQHSEARGHAARAAEAWEKLIAGGHTQRGADLAYAQGTYALLALKCGDTTGAAQFARQAIPALRAEVARTGRADLRQLLDALTTHFGRQA